MTSTKENKLAPEQAVEPLVAQDATDVPGQMEVPSADVASDANPVIGQASSEGGGVGSIDTQARRLDFWTTSRNSSAKATVSYRRRRTYASPEAPTEAPTQEEPIEAAAPQALVEYGAAEAPIEAMRSVAPTEALTAEAPVEAAAAVESIEPDVQGELPEAQASIEPLEALAPEASTEEKRPRKRRQTSKALTEPAAPAATTEERRPRKRQQKPKASTEVAAPEAPTEGTRTRKRGQKLKTLAEAVASEATTEVTQTRKRLQKREAPAETQSTPKPVTSRELLAQLASVDAQIEQLWAAEVPKVVEEIQQLMQEYDLSIDDIAGKPSVGRAAGAVPTKKKAAPLPKYRNPKTGQTWSGRGRAPAWIGTKPQRFLIDLHD
ncbi:H-NS family nucleoid-associated regulatory protein [Cupriavidus sp. DF5525]|uniref:H-NS family nucleoid-associated regulatory protein n=1 Tax=Cupriavidus sp. DF5525 TaxID=3160989 RepID=UPI0032DEE64E